MFSDKVEELLNKKYIELKSKFRPKFGNMDHISLFKDFLKIEELEKKVTKYREHAKETERAADMLRKSEMELRIAKRQAVFTMERSS